MFVYHAEALQKLDPDKTILSNQLELMEGRVHKIICRPAMIITWVFGLLLLYNYGMDWVKEQTWFHVKFTLLLGLTFYHEKNKSIIGKLKKGITPMTSFYFRLYNEVPTLFLITIVMLAVFKNTVNYLYLFGGIFFFAILLYAVTKLYKRMRS